jgi:hypothetical protein
VEGYRQVPETSRPGGVPEAGQTVSEASAFLRKLIPLPSSESVGPLSVLGTPSQGQASRSDAIGGAADSVKESAASIVSQAASVLDQEIARGVLAARGASSTAAPGYSSAEYPLLHQMHALVDNLATLWPQLQAGAVNRVPTARPAAGDTTSLVTVRPRTSVKPGEHATIAMTLRNSESRPVHLVPAATDLFGSQGGRIPSSLLEFTPAEIDLEPHEQKDLTISAPIAADAVPDRYSGLLLMKGLDYLRALINIDVAGANAAPHSAPTFAPYLPPQPAGAAAYSTPGSGLMCEATRLAEDGELGNSDAIRLLQIPHSPEDIKAVLARFDRQLTREARSKLTLEAFAPLPDGVNNQRYEPIFDRYPITGKTYTTASGTVALNEVQYYNGEMVQLHGECPNVARVSEALLGSGYRPLTIRYADGRESAIAQFWSHRLSDTSLRPYNAAFIVVAAVPDNVPAHQACFAADENGAASVLAMFDGTYDQAKASYENRVRLFFARLLDSTRVAIELGRERMGTDKRPGTIQLARNGKRRSFSVSDGAANPVARIDFDIADDPTAYLCEVARAAASAGRLLRAYPAGTEYVYPAVARIGAGPVVNWQWRTDVLPRLQRVDPNTVEFDSRSEEGAMLIRWGFSPKVLGYIPNVRGVITGVP